MQQLELLVCEGRGLAVDHDALAGEIDDDALCGLRLLCLLLAAADGAWLLEGEAHDVDVAAACLLGGESDGGICVGAGGEVGDRTAQGVDEHRKADAVDGGLDLVEPDVKGEAARCGARGKVRG